MKDKRRRGYFDTSVLIKRYIQEGGSDLARNLLAQYRFVSSRIVLIETASTLRRRRDIKDLDVRHFNAVLRRLDADRAHFDFIEPTREVLDRAEELVREKTVRSLDAIHIASTLCFNDFTGQRLPFITADVHQCRAAADAALQVVWVG